MLVGRVVGRVAVRLSDRLLDYLEKTETDKKQTVYYHSDADLGSGWELVPNEPSTKVVLPGFSEKPSNK